MITDHISKASLYYPMGALIEKSLKYLAATNFEELAAGRYDIEGDNAFALVQEYDTKPLDESLFEAHKQYIDIQYMVSGEEYIGYAPLQEQEIVQTYDTDNDCWLFKGKADLLTFTAGMFSILYPQDLHMPRVDYKSSIAVKKVVVKIKVL